MKNPTIRVIISDDHEMVRAGLMTLLKKTEGIEICGEAANGEELVELARRVKPDVILTDIRMPVMSGIEATKVLRRELPEAKVLAISVFHEEMQIVSVLEAGALGYMVKHVTGDEMARAIRTVYLGRPYYCETSSNILARMIAESKFDPYKKRSTITLDEREKAIVRLLCDQKTSQEVGEVLHMSVRTVEGYRSQIFEKMGVRNVAGMVVYAVKNGLYELG